tara:strand:- start:2452 stop:3213 length:762 start_codon:yes stop_codon:yes gene_type:complete
MNKISLAIPFYNTSRYFLDVIKYSLEDNFVSEIIVNDDASSEKEWKKLNDIVNNLDSDKIKIFRNEKNLGGFGNKYNAVKNSTSKWVYLLDSDNYLNDDTLNVIKSLGELDPNICYSPFNLLMIKDFETKPYDIVSYNFNYNVIGMHEAQDAILKKIKYFDWFLNTGNFVFNREKYLERLYNPYVNNEKTSGACSIAFVYHWMRDGGLCKIVPNMKYYHRVRSDSYWVSCGSNSQISADNYSNKIINLEGYYQ